MISKQLISRATKRLVDRFHPYKIILFGSLARGTGDDRSDADFLVICSRKKRLKTLLREMDETLEGLGLARDIVILTPEEFETDKNISGTVARYAWKEGRPLYEEGVCDKMNLKTSNMAHNLQSVSQSVSCLNRAAAQKSGSSYVFVILPAPLCAPGARGPSLRTCP